MADFSAISNEDCEQCAFCRYFNDGGGDFEDMVYHCDEENKRVSFTRSDDKPCKLPSGNYYKATYSIQSK